MDRIYVMVRVRPLDSPEDEKSSPWRINDNSISICNQSTKFEFDRIFGENCKTANVYEARTKEIVDAAVRGFNGTVFAYGQTNSGKTHTMRGSKSEPGVIPLAVNGLFNIVQEHADREFLLRMSYMEIYNEEINDLLVPEHRKLQIHESLERGIFVAGLREEIVASPEQVLDFMEFGESHRHIGETNMNLYSSRSHTIFRMIVESREKAEDGDVANSCDAVRVSVLNLVDLAGSERAAKTGAEGVRLKEGSHINKSLMTLGTVIKKLSEGAESQGGHVPYRDSKLTRILQPALGGNANTAIICNITLAQIHTDETKSSLQFASRALRVTNCAHVNEILTDAALLKRQKKEIQELREKLLGSHSEHSEEEILNLRNTLLQSELERERIALELQEEKKAQAQRDKRLQEQAKKIADLSSMVLYSHRNGKTNYTKKNKRRDTWCPGALLGSSPRKELSATPWNAAIGEPFEGKHESDLPPFEELALETEESVAILPNGGHIPENVNDYDQWDGCTLPDAYALSRVTNRRKPALEKMTPIMENDDLLELQTQYEDLLLEFEAQRTMKDIVVDSLMKKLAEAESFSNRKQSNISDFQLSESSSRGGKNLTVRESQAIIVIKQLQEQIEVLEIEKSSMQSDLDSLVDLATKQNEAAREKYEELRQELLDAREAAIVAREHLCSATTDGAFEDYTIEFSMEVQGMILEVQHSRDTVNGFLSVVNDLFQSLSLASNTLLEFKPSICQSIVHLKSIGDNHQKLYSFLTSKVEELEEDKAFLHKQSTDQRNQIEELKLNIQSFENAQQENCQGQALEKAEFESQIRVLEKEICSLSSSSLVREKESLRKELEKAKTKLKDTEFKLKNCIQDKIKIEGEKAYAERELKQLHGQKNLLERNISKRESLADKRRDSKAFDLNKTKSQIGKVEQSLQLTAMELERTNFDYEILLGDYRKLEASTFEMGEKIASLEEELTTTLGEKEEALTRNGILASELEAASNMLNTTNAQLKILQEEIESLSLKLGESESLSKQMESSISLLSREKEEVAMQLTDALLQLEEENAVWSDKEKSFIESITEQAKVRHEMDYYREQCEVFKELLNLSEEKIEQEKKTSMEKSLEIDQLTNDLTALEAQSVQCQEVLKSRIDILSSEHHLACEEVEKLQKQLNVVNEERERLSLQIKEMDTGLDQSTDWKPNLPKNLFITSDGNEKLLATNKELKKIMAEMEDKKAACRELEMLKQNYDVMLSNARIDVEELSERLSSLEAKISEDDLKFNKESTKLRLRLRMTQLKLDAIRGRHREAVDELELVDRKFKEASAKLKEQLVSSRLENLQLTKQIAAKNFLDETANKK